MDKFPTFNYIEFHHTINTKSQHTIPGVDQLFSYSLKNNSVVSAVRFFRDAVNKANMSKFFDFFPMQYLTEVSIYDAWKSDQDNIESPWISWSRTKDNDTIVSELFSLIK